MKNLDSSLKEADATHADMMRYMDHCWEINNDALIDVKLLVEEFIQRNIEADPFAFLDDIATEEAITLPSYIVELAKAAMKAAAAGAAFDKARCSFEEQVIKPVNKVTGKTLPKVRDTSQTSEPKAFEKSETLMGFPAVQLEDED
jgi:hypothetical protein